MSRYHGSKCLDDSNREFLQRRRRTAKNSRFRLAKKQLCTCITLFCTLRSRSCTTVASHAGVFRGGRFSSLLGRDEKRVPLKTPAWEASMTAT